MSIIFLNGHYIEGSQSLISHTDSGFTTGIGIFDSMLVKDKKLIYAREHFERIIYDTHTVIGLELSFDFKKFEEICNKLIEENNFNESYLRVRTTITGGEVKAPLVPAQKLTILVEVKPAASPDNIAPANSIIATDYPRIARCVLENCKRLDYTCSYAARRYAENLGADEAILTNTDGNIACGTTSNVFIEKRGVLITPPLTDGVLAGVTRRKLIEERDITEESISIERLKNADKIYLTNSFIGLRDVVLM